ncbi:MAG: aminotransferase class I/II-fold pyridoxal phosphate-dependent enzyme [Gammaproteobacteria bacterium]|jgi:methionine transaminase|nr:aminotransferase class I/II-fold pyridoxal phosphate-dependent enzyme [Gammaproteobacteria bacterium]MBT7371138.1 aminotransferase class I/II-fold pyridoxal phosphate-dependent enzyme [Gammaproteobacteria bacterium]
MSIKSKLPDIGTTIFTVMSKMAADHQAINLSQGYPDFAVPEALLERLNHYAVSGNNQYPPMHGIGYLREQIAQLVKTTYGAAYDVDNEITVVSGATEGLFVAIHAIVRSGDEVIVFDPAYDSYDPAVSLAGGRTIHLPLSAPDFRIDWDLVRRSINNKTRAIIVNSPHNPTGAILSSDDLNTLAAIVDSKDIYLISDEVYEHMVFGNAHHHSFASHDLLKHRTFVVSSFGKTYHATGWKVGYCLAPADMTHEFRKIHQFVTFTTHTPSQWAIADFLEHHPEHHVELPAFYQAKRDFFLEAMQGIGFRMSPSPGTYFQLAAYDDLSRLDDQAFVTEITTKAGVAAIPVSVFYDKPPEMKVIRFCFAKEEDTLQEAADRLRAYFA